MTYVLSDIYGEYDKYQAMLEKISLKITDVVYILGNIIDYGEDGIKILTDMSYRANVIPIIGEHEYMALRVLRGILDCGGNPTDEIKAELAQWIQEGGRPTLSAFMALSDDEKEGIVEYLEEFSAVEEVEAGDKTYVLVSAGLKNFSAEKDVYDYSIEELIYEGVDYGKSYFEDKILVTGNNPTCNIEGAQEGKIYSANGHIAVDCGVYVGDNLGCICLENGKEFYVK